MVQERSDGPGPVSAPIARAGAAYARARSHSVSAVIERPPHTAPAALPTVLEESPVSGPSTLASSLCSSMASIPAASPPVAASTVVRHGYAACGWCELV